MLRAHLTNHRHPAVFIVREQPSGPIVRCKFPKMRQSLGECLVIVEVVPTVAAGPPAVDRLYRPEEPHGNSLRLTPARW